MQKPTIDPIRSCDRALSRLLRVLAHYAESADTAKAREAMTAVGESLATVAGVRASVLGEPLESVDGDMIPVESSDDVAGDDESDSDAPQGARCSAARSCIGFR